MGVSPLAAEILEYRETYVEISPSGQGLRLIVEGEEDTGFECDAIGVEVYTARHYLTITGAKVEGAPGIGPASRTLARLKAAVAEHKNKKQRKAQSSPPGGLSGSSGPGGSEDPQRIRDALTHIDPGPRDAWLNMGMAIKAELGDGGYFLWCDWAQASPKFDAHDARRVWDSFKSEGITIRTLLKEARDNGWRSPRKETKRQTSRAKAAPPPPERVAEVEEGASDTLAELNEEFAVVKVGSKVRVMTLEDQRGALVPSYMTLPDFKAYEDKYRIDSVNEDTGDLKKIGRGTWWLKHPERRQYRAVVFEPGASEEKTRGKFNLWQGFAVEPAEGDCSLYIDHIKKIICSGNEEHYTYLLDLMAYCVQSPGVRPEVSPVLKGDEGAGKGTFVHPYGRLFGPHYRQVSQPSHLVGNFNAHLQQTRVLFADEALFAGDPKMVGSLKALITEPEIQIEPKGVDTYPVANHLFIVMASNNDWVVPAGPDARRFFVLQVSDARLQDFAYFEAINKEMENGGQAALLHLLLNRDLSNFNVRNVPKTEALADQKARSRKGVDLLVELLCDEGRLPCMHGLHFDVAVTSGEHRGEGFWPAVRKWVPSLKHDSSAVIRNTLKKKWGFMTYEANGTCGLRFPPLEELRAKFVARHGVKEWGRVSEWGQEVPEEYEK